MWPAVALLLPLFQPAPVRVLFLVGGDYHDYDEAPRVLADALRKKMAGAVPIEFHITKDLHLLRAEELSKFDLLMLNLCQQTELSDRQKEGLLGAVRGGLPLVALHCTFWCFQSWPEFHRLLGAFVPGHARFGPMCVEAADASNPVVSRLPFTFELTDEPYLVDRRDPSMHVLIRTCKTYEKRDSAEPEVWTKTYSKGRVFAMTFGHDQRSQQDPNYIELLSSGILWALGRGK
ncbi:MAG: ThuA domain-containing protein [Acidobacteria bacterium]|nr:ThuA domain-containing protein [Acidobacteriota bacterium]